MVLSLTSSNVTLTPVILSVILITWSIISSRINKFLSNQWKRKKSK